MRSEPDWLTADHLRELNQLIVAETGEPFAVLKAGELDSAVHRPQHLWHYEGEDDLAVLAVRLMLGIAQNHPFAQGNKRTGFEAAAIFLEANGWELAVEDTAHIADMLVAAIEEPALEGALVSVFRDNLVEMD